MQPANDDRACPKPEHAQANQEPPHSEDGNQIGSVKKHRGRPNVNDDQLRREASSAASSSWNVTIPPTDESVACPADRRSDRATAQPTSPMQIRVIESDRANTNRRTAPSKSSPSCRSTEHRARAFACRQLARNAVARRASCRSGAHQTDRPAIAPSPFQRLWMISCDAKHRQLHHLVGPRHHAAE